MRGIVFLGERELELREFPDPRPGPGEVVLAMKASGMCGSDLHPYRASRSDGAEQSFGLGDLARRVGLDGVARRLGLGRVARRVGLHGVARRLGLGRVARNLGLDRVARSPGLGGAAQSLGLGGARGPVIAGHEPCGVVVERGPGVLEADAPTGARVMCHHYKGCGHCKHCRAGWSQLCPHGIVVYGMTGHGGHAPYMVAPASTLVPLPEALSFEEGAAVSCGTGTAYQALRRLDISGRDTLAVFGQGPVGVSATMLGVAMGARVIAIDIGSERRDLGRELGADAVVDPGTTDVVAALKSLTDGEGVDAALDCTGQPDARLAAVRATRTWGRVGLVGEGKQVTFDVSPDLLRRQLTIHASWTFSTLIQDECARFIVTRGVPLKRLLTHRFRIAEAADAYRLFDTQTTGKGVFVFD